MPDPTPKFSTALRATGDPRKKDRWQPKFTRIEEAEIVMPLL
jgi:hypothetical protein